MSPRGSSTKQKLLDIAKEQIMTKGYNATTVEEICNIAEVTKGAFFYYFKTKEDLGVSVLQDYWQTRQRQFADSDWSEALTPQQKLAGFLDTIGHVFIHDPKGYSCLAGIFSQELATVNPTMQELVASLFDEWTAQVIPILEELKSARPNIDVDVDHLADHIVVVLEGAIVLALARQNPKIITQQLAVLNTHIQMIFRS